MSTVHVVFCMDTEGPCDDPINLEIDTLARYVARLAEYQ